MTEKRSAAKSAQWGGEIETGQTGGTIAANDPADASPAYEPGAPPQLEEIAWARSREISHGDAALEREQASGPGRSLVLPAILIGVCAGFVIVAALLFFSAA